MSLANSVDALSTSLTSSGKRVVINSQYNCFYIICGNRLDLYVSSDLSENPTEGERIVLGKIPVEFLPPTAICHSVNTSNLFILHDGTVRLGILSPSKWMYHNLSVWKV